jgi:hypothetical protein
MIDMITLWSCPRHEGQANLQGAIECLANCKTIRAQNHLGVKSLMVMLTLTPVAFSGVQTL